MSKLTNAEKSEMVKSVEGIVVSQARKYAARSNGHLNPEDLAQIGRMAALVAVGTYDAARGAAYSTYAFTAVKQALSNEVRTSRVARASITLDAALFGDDSETYLDGLPSDAVLADVGLEKAQREQQVRAIVEEVKAEHFATKPELFDAIVSRLMLAVEVSRPAIKGEAQTTRSELTLESIASKFACSKQWVSKLEMLVKNELSLALEGV